MPSHRALGPQLRAALGRIHAQGFIQADVRDINILIRDATGEPVFVDFALAFRPDDEELFEVEADELRAMLCRADAVCTMIGSLCDM